MAVSMLDSQRTGLFPTSRAPQPANNGSERWSFTRFAFGVVGLSGLILASFAIPIGIIAATTGYTWLLWVCLPHMALASVILGGILSAMFLLDAPDDAGAPAWGRWRTRTAGPGPTTPGATRRAA